MYLTPLVWIGRVTSTLSIVGSSSIIYMILADWTLKLTRPYHRFMLLMSIFDVLSSIAIAISVLAIPREEEFYGAKGNQATCDAQGFLMVLGMAVPLYNASLNIYYVLTIRYNVSFQQFSKFEPILHAVSILIPFTMALILTTGGNMVPAKIGRCSPSGELSLFMLTSILGYSFFVSIISMVSICWTTIIQATKMAKYTNFGRRRHSAVQRTRVENDKRDTIRQALLYVSAFVMTYAFPFAIAISTKAKAGGVPPYILLVFTSILYPLQGFWNFLFYIRPGVRHAMQIDSTISYLGAIWNTVLNPEMSRPRRQSVEFNRLQTFSLRSQLPDGTAAATRSTNSLLLTNDSAGISNVSRSDLEPKGCDDPEGGSLGLSLFVPQQQTQQAVSFGSGSRSTIDPSHERQIAISENKNQSIESTHFPEENCTNSSNTKSESVLKHQVSDHVAVIMSRKKLSDISEDAHFDNDISCVINSTDHDNTEEDPDHQLDLLSQQKTKPRRVSLVKFAPIMNGEA